MRILLDENLPHALRHDFSNHHTETTRFAGLAGFSNGALLRSAADRFDVFVTLDRNLSAQNNLAQLDLIVVVLSAGAGAGDVAELRPLIPRVLKALDHAVPGEIIEISA